MSIVNDFKSINSRLRGDDWWKPAQAGVTAFDPAAAQRSAEVITGAIPVRNGSCGMTTAAEGSQWSSEELAALISMSPMPVVLNKRLIERPRKPD